MDQNRTTESVIVSGGFYTVVTVQIDVFESRIIDEKHFATEEEAKEYQAKTIMSSENNIYCFVSLVAQGVKFMGVLGFLSMIYIAYKIVGEEWGMGDYYRNCARNEKPFGLLQHGTKDTTYSQI